MDSRSLGLMIIIAGLAAALLGAAVFTGALSWFGRLPGDIRIEGQNMRVYIPIVSMLLISLGLSALIAIGRRLF
jgi:hypothetical protein